MLTEPKNAFDKAYGLEYLLKDIKPAKDWQETKNSFLEAVASYEKIEKKLYKLEESLNQVPTLKNKISEIRTKILRIDQKINSLEDESRELTAEQEALNQSLNRIKDSIKYHKEAQPSFIEIIIDILSNFKNYKTWREKYNDLLEKLELLNKNSEDKNQEIRDLENQKTKITKHAKVLAKELSSNQNNLDKNVFLINEYKLLMGNNFPDNDFWESSDEKLQLQLPWNFKELHNLRSELFVKALDLHKAFIINVSKERVVKDKNGKERSVYGPLINNLKVMNSRMTGFLPEKHLHVMPHIWATFFCVVPTVSTTFASFTNLCRELKADDIGYLLIDEAGQAIPQAAAGAIYRSKRVIVVGDPMQIKPVITTPKAMIDALKDYHEIESDLFNPLEQSVQTLADRENPFGTFIGKDENRKWVGCPLRVHRRCNDPMFKISNNIAYDNLMINATRNNKSNIENIYPESLWFDVKANQASGNWLAEEGKVVIEILTKIIQGNKELPSLYIISPFKTVASNMKKMLTLQIGKIFGSNFNKREIDNWINKSVGTIHTFQGKEAEAVILLLGGNPKKPGSLNWAAKEPNILNVGLDLSTFFRTV